VAGGENATKSAGGHEYSIVVGLVIRWSVAVSSLPSRILT